MRALRYQLVLLVVGTCLMAGCSSSSTSDRGGGSPSTSEAEKNFSEIVQFWRTRCPEGNFHYPPIREVDGPRDNTRLHVPVPTGLVSQYRHPYPADFLESKRAKGADLEKLVADDLLNLKLPLLFKREGALKISYDGGKTEVTCDDFVVSWKKE